MLYVKNSRYVNFHVVPKACLILSRYFLPARMNFHSSLTFKQSFLSIKLRFYYFFSVGLQIRKVNLIPRSAVICQNAFSEDLGIFLLCFFFILF